jgi:predicted mannosyl-3-phosphoglycerate phosphatase (HAD superfamily)
VRVVYVDVDGTLLGPDGSLLRDADGDFCDAAIRALGLLHHNDVPVVLVSGRGRGRLEATSRMLGADGVLPEMGSADSDYPRERGQSVYEAIEATGITDLLLAREPGLERHPAGLVDREGSHVLWGTASADADVFVRELSGGALKLVDNGRLGPDGAHIFHLLPADASKAAAVARDIAARGADAASCLAIGDSRQDLEMRRIVGAVAIVANGARDDPEVARDAEWVTSAPHGAGVLEAVQAWLADVAPPSRAAAPAG